MNTPNQPNLNPAAQFIANCELAECTPPAESLTARGAVVGSSLIAFAEGVSAQIRQDLMDSLLFADRVANKAFDPEKQADQWYEQYRNVLNGLGWLAPEWRFARYEASGRRFSMDRLGLEVLASSLATVVQPGPASAGMLKIAADAVKALSAKEQPLRLFEHQTRTHQGAHFRIVSCFETDGQVKVAMGAVRLQARSQVTNVLFWEWSGSDVQVWRGESSLELNSRLYAEHRELVQQRLGASSRQAIAEFDI